MTARPAVLIGHWPGVDTPSRHGGAAAPGGVWSRGRVEPAGGGAGTTVDGTPARIGPARNVTAEVGGDQAQQWTIDAQGTRVVVISVQAQEAVAAFSMVAAPDADPVAVPDAAAVAERGMAKLLAAR